MSGATATAPRSARSSLPMNRRDAIGRPLLLCDCFHREPSTAPASTSRPRRTPAGSRSRSPRRLGARPLSHVSLRRPRSHRDAALSRWEPLVKIRFHEQTAAIHPLAWCFDRLSPRLSRSWRGHRSAASANIDIDARARDVAQDVGVGSPPFPAPLANFGSKLSVWRDRRPRCLPAPSRSDRQPCVLGPPGQNLASLAQAEGLNLAITTIRARESGSRPITATSAAA